MEKMNGTEPHNKLHFQNTYYPNQQPFHSHNRFPHGGYNQPRHNPNFYYYYGHGNPRNNNNSSPNPWGRDNNNMYRKDRFPQHQKYNNNNNNNSNNNNNMRYHRYNNNNHRHHNQHQRQNHHMQHPQNQQQHMSHHHPGPMSDRAAVLHSPVSGLEENTTSPHFQPAVPHATPCLPGSSASSTKSESNSNCSEQEEPQQQTTVCQIPKPQTNPAPPTIPNSNGFRPSPYSDSFDNCYGRIMTLDDAIWKKFQCNQQTVDIYRKKMELWRELFDLFKATHAANYPRYSLQVVGSTMSGFGSRRSDVDICLMIRRSEVDQRIEAVDRLHELQASLQKIPYMENIELIYAKVPILKFRDKSRDLEVDLNCNNSVGIRNTHLLFCYSQLDVRVKPLVLVVKLWAQFHGINDAKAMTISSYSLVLMVIHYLQSGCKEPVLPCLHNMYPDKFSPYLDVEKIKINEQIPKWDSYNRDSLGELLVGFLEYYARKFDYARSAISVRLGCHMPIKLCMQTRSYKNDPHQWKYLCVEEPFDLTNTARSVYDKEAFDKIRGVFYASWQRLAYTGELDSVFHEIPEIESRAIAARMAPIFR